MSSMSIREEIDDIAKWSWSNDICASAYVAQAADNLHRLLSDEDRDEWFTTMSQEWKSRLYGSLEELVTFIRSANALEHYLDTDSVAKVSSAIFDVADRLQMYLEDAPLSEYVDEDEDGFDDEDGEL